MDGEAFVRKKITAFYMTLTRLKNFVLVVYFSIFLYQLCNLCVIRTFSKRYNSIWKGASSSLHIMFEPWRSKRDLSLSSTENALHKGSDGSAHATQKVTL